MGSSYIIHSFFLLLKSLPFIKCGIDLHFKSIPWLSHLLVLYNFFLSHSHFYFYIIFFRIP